jgi:multidrug efflux pump subunit AcrA (membrane-fusion protein)
LLDVAPEQAAALRNLANAQGAIDDAEMSLYILNSSPSQDAFDTASASLLFKEQTLTDLQDQVKKLQDQIKTAPNENMKERLESQLLRLNVQLAQQQLEVEKAQYKYATLDDSANPIDLEVAQTRLATAQAQLEDVQRQWQAIEDGPASSDVALAKVALAEAQAEWERIKDGPDPEEVAIVETKLEKAKLELQVKKQEKIVVELVAPMDGTVISIGADIGERIGAQTLITIADLSQPYLEIFIDETDMEKAQVGNPVEVTFEALSDEIFTGTIVEVNPGLVEQNRVQAIRALVRLDETSYAKPVSLPIGLSASVDVIAAKTTNAVLIPLEALRQITPGEYGVYVLENNQPKFRIVSVGLEDYTYAEITSGLEAGEIVITGNVSTE